VQSVGLVSLIASAWRSTPPLAVVVQLAVVEVIHVIVVADGAVTAAWAVLVVVYVGGHAVTFFLMT
jgi:hypothetical protein